MCLGAQVIRLKEAMEEAASLSDNASAVAVKLAETEKKAEKQSKQVRARKPFAVVPFGL